jgi:hypothetical protein
MITIKEIEEELDRTFKRNCMGDDDDEIPLVHEVYALETAVRKILNFLDRNTAPVETPFCKLVHIPKYSK